MGPFSVYYLDSFVASLFDFVSTSVLVAYCTFLHNLLILNIYFGCCRHSVFNTSVQLTEGRSARDQPKQLPAKKNKKPGAQAASRCSKLWKVVVPASSQLLNKGGELVHPRPRR